MEGDEEFDLRLVDSDGQVMNLDSTSVVQIKQGQGSEGTTRGTTVFTFEEGVTTVSGVVFSESPGAQGVTYSLNSEALN